MAVLRGILAVVKRMNNEARLIEARKRLQAIGEVKVEFVSGFKAA